MTATTMGSSSGLACSSRNTTAITSSVTPTQRGTQAEAAGAAAGGTAGGSGGLTSARPRRAGDEEGRTMRYDVTHANLYGRFVAGRYRLTIRTHRTGEEEDVPIPITTAGGHSGGDFGIVRSFVNALQGIPDDSVTTARESLESHLLAFAAEESRLQHTTINMADYRTRVEAETRQLYGS